MTDIKRCPGTGCPLKEKCQRHLASDTGQGTFMVPPIVQKPTGEKVCHEFISVED